MTVYGQISEKEMSMSLGKQNGFSLKVNTNDADEVEKLWKAFAKDFGRFKTNRKANELYAEQIKISSVNGKDKLDVYVKITAEEDQSFFQIWMDMGTGFINSTDHPDQYGKTMEMLTEFQYEASKSIIKDELDGEEKMLSKQERDLKQLKNDQEKYYKEIERAEETIRKMEENIKQNEQDQKDSEKLIKEQQEKIKSVEDKLEKLEKEKS
jgi:DNA repair ATPase RecN